VFVHISFPIEWGEYVATFIFYELKNAIHRPAIGLNSKISSSPGPALECFDERITPSFIHGFGVLKCSGSTTTAAVPVWPGKDNLIRSGEMVT